MTNKWKQTRKLLVMIIPTLLYVTAVIVALRLLPIKSIWSSIILIVTASLIVKLFLQIKKKETPKPFDWLKSAAKTGVIVFVFVLVATWLGGFGFVGLLAIVLLFVTYILVRRRKEYFKAMRTVEKMIWGKELTRGNKRNEARESLAKKDKEN